MSGAGVRQLQLRLAALKYYPGPVDGRFGQDTLEAVWAFQEVQGITPTGDVGPATQQALADPRLPVVLVPGGGCAYAITPTGDFTTTTFMPGWVTVPLGQMYNPVFFIDTAYAIHGDTDVPLQPVSHGCVRIPMDIAEFFYPLVPTPGTPVYIRQ
jgi:Putative peptidoglycan binding domain/L,D-transpeptidase catalytic domain